MVVTLLKRNSALPSKQFRFLEDAMFLYVFVSYVNSLGIYMDLHTKLAMFEARRTTAASIGVNAAFGQMAWASSGPRIVQKPITRQFTGITPQRKTMYLQDQEIHLLWRDEELSTERWTVPTFHPWSPRVLAVEISNSLQLGQECGEGATERSRKFDSKMKFVVKKQALVTCSQHQSHNSQSFRSSRSRPYGVQVLQGKIFGSCGMLHVAT